MSFKQELVCIRRRRFAPIDLFLRRRSCFFKVKEQRSQYQLIGVRSDQLACRFRNSVRALSLASAGHLAGEKASFRPLCLFRIRLLRGLFRALPGLLIHRAHRARSYHVRGILVGNRLLCRRVVLQGGASRLTYVQEIRQVTVRNSRSLVKAGVAIRSSRRYQLPSPTPTRGNGGLSKFRVRERIVRPIVTILGYGVGVASNRVGSLLIFIFVGGDGRIAMVSQRRREPFRRATVLPNVGRVQQGQGVVRGCLPIPVVNRGVLVRTASVRRASRPFRPFPHSVISLHLLLSTSHRREREDLPYSGNGHVIGFFLESQGGVDCRTRRDRVLVHLLAIHVNGLRRASRRGRLFFNSRLCFRLFTCVPGGLLFIRCGRQVIVRVTRYIMGFGVLFVKACPRITKRVEVGNAAYLLPFGPRKKDRGDG